jgi:spore coat protein U-like protein
MIALAAWAFASTAHAATCVIAGTSGLAFGVYDSQSREPLDSSGKITIRCAAIRADDRVTVDFMRGPLFLENAIQRLEYGLFLDPARTVRWGDGTGGTARFGPVRPSKVIEIPVFGRIPAQQAITPGAYADSLVVTVSY